jgi:hypothetical protein
VLQKELRNRFGIAAQSLLIASKELRHYFEISLQSLHYRSAIAEK